MRKIAVLFMILFFSFLMSACGIDEKTYTTTCVLTSEGSAIELDYEEYVETYIYNNEEVIEILVNSESVDKGLIVEVGSSTSYLYGYWDTVSGLGAACTDFHWEQ